jgi:hypothetical protein
MTLEKPKRDVSNPFAAELVPGEQILWMSGGNPASIRRALLKYAGVAAAVVLVIPLVAVFEDGIDALGTGLSISLITAVAALAGAALVVLYNWLMKSRPSARVYAVSNFRVFMRYKGSTGYTSIEDLPQVIKFEGSRGYGTLNFGAAFPNFTDVPDVNQVYQLITGLQKKQTFLAK